MHTAPTPRPEPDDEPAADASGVVRPDEMSGELCKFLAAIDAYRRASGQSQLAAPDVRKVLHALGYRREGEKVDARTFERDYEAALAGYKQRTKRLFPNWSEIHGLLREAGWRREAA
ncbi:MAG: hypothetical protein EPO68_11040 [Planctomycetota bacterium]|nr:MAG: hypothetical protein EPO68_11040 [Planctomycetota bacterium]